MQISSYGLSTGSVVEASRLTEQKGRRYVHVTLSRLRRGGRSFNSALFAGVQSEAHVTFSCFVGCIMIRIIGEGWMGIWLGLKKLASKDEAFHFLFLTSVSG